MTILIDIWALLRAMGHLCLAWWFMMIYLLFNHENDRIRVWCHYVRMVDLAFQPFIREVVGDIRSEYGKQ
jgi:hypothetical protein